MCIETLGRLLLSAGQILFTVYMHLVWIAYSILCLILLTTIVAEFEVVKKHRECFMAPTQAFNVDIYHDTNVYQLPVLRHYCTLHARLRILNEHLDRCAIFNEDTTIRTDL